MTVPVQQVTRTPLLTISVWSKSYVFRGRLTPLTVDASFRWNEASSVTFTVPSDDRRIADLRAQGARAVINYFADQDDAEPTLNMSGVLIEQSGQPRSGRVTPVTFTIEDDWVDVMQRTIGWPSPDAPIGSQAVAYNKVKGPAETVARDIIRRNIERIGKPLTIPASLGRGSIITVRIRMHPLVDRLFPAVDEAGIGVRIIQQGSARHLVFSERDTYPMVLSDLAGEVAEGGYRITAPTVTRLVCGASGKKEARIFRLKVDTARESAWGMVREEFLDCRDIDYPSTDFEDDVTDRANERLAETGPTSGCNARLQESARMWVGREIRLGTNVQIQLGDGPVVADVVREIRVTSSPAGVTVEPLVGLWDESGDAKLLKLLAKGIKQTRDLGVE